MAAGALAVLWLAAIDLDKVCNDVSLGRHGAEKHLAGPRLHPARHILWTRRFVQGCRRADARREKSGKVPKWANRMVRQVFEAHADGDAAIRRVVQRINDIDRLVNQRIVLEQTTRRGWRARSEESGVEAAA